MRNCCDDQFLMDCLSSEYEIIPLNPSVNYESESDVESDVICGVGSTAMEEDFKEIDSNVDKMISHTELQNINFVKEIEAEQMLVSNESYVNVNSSSHPVISDVIAGNDKISCEDTLKHSEKACDNNNNVKNDDSIDSTLDSASKPVEAIETGRSTKKVKKKLNLQEYKQLRGNPHMTCSLKDVKDTLLEELKSSGEMLTSLPPIPLPSFNKDGSRKDNKTGAPENMEMAKPLHLSDNPDNYEEIIIVSIGCNTDMSIPSEEIFAETTVEDDLVEENESRTLKNIVNDLKKENKQNILLSHTTLLASIQNIVTNKKQTPSASAPCSLQKVEFKMESDEQHGEDKVIMHLRKDRSRQETRTIETQTTNLLQFPPLNKLWIKKCNNSNNKSNVQKNYRSTKYDSDDDGKSNSSRSRSRSSNRNYRPIASHNRQRKSSQRNKSISSSMYSSESDSDYSSKRRHRRRSRSSSASSYTSTDSSNSSGSSSSSSYDRDMSRRGQRQRNYSYRSNQSHYSNGSRRSRSRSRSSYYRRRSNSRRSTSSGRYYYDRPRRSYSRQKGSRNSSNSNIKKEVVVDPDSKY